MKSNKILYPIILIMIILSSCDYENPLDKEQYKKTLYLIGASANLQTKELVYSDEEQEGFITVGVSGSLLVDQEVTANLVSHNSVINWYNKKFKFLATDIKYQPLASQFYEIPSHSTTLHPGETYARLPFKVRTKGLECDSLYALTFKIDSSSDFEINQKDSALIVTFNLVNQYSGNYIFKGLRHELDADGNDVSLASITGLRTLKATNERAVRFYHEQQAEKVGNNKEYGIVMSMDANDQVTMSAWEDFNLIESTCSYDKETKVFTVSYKYRLSDKTYRMEGTFTYQDGTE